MALYAHIVGWGKYVPERIVTNIDIAKFMDTSDDWIKTRTGISERRFADKSLNCWQFLPELPREDP